jgi:hypothetical protein
MLPCRSGRVRIGRALFILLLVCALGSTATGEGKGRKRKKQQEKAEAQKKEDTVPLPVGHEAKGLVLPDYNLRGLLSNRFVAGIAKRLDDNHLQMRDLKMTTYTEQQKPDLQIDMSDSVLDLKTKVISTQKRTTVRRTDFEIAGDTMQFDTTTRQGTMSGNVKMVITGQAQLMPKGNQ